MANKVDEVKGNTLPVQLSGNDQTAPDTHASIYNILTNKNLAALNSNFKMDLTAVRTLRYRAFNEIKNIFDKEATNDYPRYWNRNVKNFTVIGLNLFANNIGLQPIAHLIECFWEVRETETYKNAKVTGKHKCKLVSFGINKKYFETYLEILTGDETLKLPPKLPTKSGNPVFPDAVLYGKVVIGLENNSDGTAIPGSSVKVTKTPVYMQFKDWAFAKRMKINAAVLYAMAKLMEAEPVDNLNTKAIQTAKITQSLEYQNIRTVKFDKSKNAIISIYMNPYLADLLYQVVQNYNREMTETGNFINNKLSVSTLGEIAVKHLFDTRPDIAVKYGDPKMYEMLVELNILKTKQIEEALNFE